MAYSMGLIVTKELKRTIAEIENAKLHVSHTLLGLPQWVDWRKEGGRNWTGPVRDQSNCGSCVAHSGVKVAAISRRVERNEYDADVEMSAYDLFRHGGNCRNGWTLERGGSAFAQYGACPQKCYDDDAVEHECCKEQKFKILDIQRIASDAEAKKWITEHGAVWAAIDVYDDDFYENMLSPDEVYHNNGSGSPIGAHAVCLCGYDDTKGAWLLCNSWGQSWADNGFCWFGYGENGCIRSYAAYGIKVGFDKLSCAITPSPAVIVLGGSLQLNGNPTGGKPPYTHEWIENVYGDNYINSTTIQNPIFSGAPIGKYTYSYKVTDSAGTEAVNSTVISVQEKPPLKTDITIKKAGTVIMKVMYVKSTVPDKTNLVINGTDIGPVRKMYGKTLTLGKFDAGDILAFALNTPQGQVQNNVNQDMGWAGIWYVMMNQKAGSKGSDVTLYIQEVNTKMEMAVEQTEMIDNMLNDLILEAIDIGEKKQAIAQAMFMTLSESPDESGD